jgi:hypothetical protein
LSASACVKLMREVLAVPIKFPTLTLVIASVSKEPIPLEAGRGHSSG